MTAVYWAFKTLVTSFTKSLVVKLSQHGIRVNAIAPETNNYAQILVTPRVPQENLKHLTRWFPISRFGEGSDSGDVALFLALDTLSGCVPGTTIHVDGGMLVASAWVCMTKDVWTHLPLI